MIMKLDLLGNELIKLYFRFYKDPKSTDYQRQVFSLLDWFGNIGGVNELFKSMWEILVSIFSGRIFMFSILSALYQVDPSIKSKHTPTSIFQKFKLRICILIKELFLILNCLMTTESSK